MGQLVYQHQGIDFSINGDLGAFTCTQRVELMEDDRFILYIELNAKNIQQAPQMEIIWQFNATAALCRWTTRRGASHHLPADWQGYTEHSQATAQAPVLCFHHHDGGNRFTFAFDDAMHPVRMKAGINEEHAQVDCRIQPFNENTKPQQQYKMRVLIDQRQVPYYCALQDVSRWWASFPNYQPCHVPEIGKLPMYSTWYSLHQELDSTGIEHQSALSKEIGCRAVIVDDGWQTEDNQRGYAFTGDWQAERLTDMKNHVQRIHDMGMKYMLWYSVPYVGFNSRVYQQFSGKFLYEQDRQQAAILDPRYPDVREYLIAIYENAMRTWNLDGFKLDFVDCFSDPGEDMPNAASGRDFACVYEGADQLMRDIYDRLSAINPEVLIEFRQTYIGPLMRRYGNLFRAGDCPMDAITNRVRTLDIRLLAGSTATHSDMIMWHKDDSVENAALQLLNVFFSVPQISVLLDQIPSEHQRMLQFYLGLWQEHRDCLLDGELVPLHPQQLYPQVYAYNETSLVAVNYTGDLLCINQAGLDSYIVINASGNDHLVIDAPCLGQQVVTITDCCGETLSRFDADFAAHPIKLRIPASGLASLSAVNTN